MCTSHPWLLMKSYPLLSLLTIASLSIKPDNVFAQTVPPSVRTPQADNTLGTQVAGADNNFTVTGGLNRGQTLFHSFTDFSIPTGGAANFINPVGTRDIITRVTGNLFSDLNGTLNSNGANFLLINPNGVVFGANVQLNVGKSFAASTANGVDLVGSNGQLYSFGTSPGSDTPLLTVNPNVFLNISRLNLGASTIGNPGIVNYGTLQTTNDSQYIGLIGGNVTLDGGKIVAPGGRVDLGGLKTVGTVGIDAQGLGFGGDNLTRGDVLLTNGGSVNVRADRTLGQVNIFSSDVAALGSNVNIHANNIIFANSPTSQKVSVDAGLETNTGVQTQATGGINIDATGQVKLDNAIVRNNMRSGTSGSIGDLKIKANSLNLTNGSLLSTNIAGKGSGGNIDIKTSGDVSISGSTPQSTLPISASSPASSIAVSLDGEGNTGTIKIDTQNRGKLLLSNNGSINSGIYEGAVGNGRGVSISATSVDLRNQSSIASINYGGTGNMGNIDIKTTGDVSVFGSTPGSTALITPSSNLSFISSDTFGRGNSGKVNIDTQNIGKISLANYANISSQIDAAAVGNSGGVALLARSIELQNGGSITSINLGGTGTAGDINLKTTGDISISSYQTQPAAATIQPVNISSISSGTNGLGNAGKISISTGDRGQLKVFNQATINNTIGKNAIGNGNDINISTGSVNISNRGKIDTSNTGGRGNAGNIQIDTTGDVSITGAAAQTPGSSESYISSNTSGVGNAGSIRIDTKDRGKVSLANRAFIASGLAATGVGNGGEIAISSNSLDLRNNSSILANNAGGKGNAGDIQIKTAGDIQLNGSAQISSDTTGVGNAGKINITTQNRGDVLLNRSTIGSGIGTKAIGNGTGLTIAARSIELDNQSSIFSVNGGGTGNAANISIQTSKAVTIANNSALVSSNVGTGTTGDINLNSDRVTLNNGAIEAQSSGATGGNIQVVANDKLLLRNSSKVTTNSGSKNLNGNGGNINVTSPLLIATPGNNDISANAFAGTGGNVSILSQGLFGIQNRPIGTSFSNDITASSTFGQSGNVNIDTPGVDPGKDSTELPTAPTDASNQIAQACNPTNQENKLTVTGRGGLPPNASDLLASDVVWQDPRSVTSQSSVTSATNPVQIAPPATGWVLDGRGKVTLVAAGITGQPTGARAGCPNSIGK